jgi:hypothetical protein
MTYGSRQRHPKNRATQPRPRFAAAVRATARCRRALGARLLYLSGTGISLSAASAAAERAGGRGRVEVGIHGETAAQLDSAGAVIRLCQGTFDQRSGQPYVAHAAATRPRARSWLSRSRFRHALFSWSIVSIACVGETGPNLQVLVPDKRRPITTAEPACVRQTSDARVSSDRQKENHTVASQTAAFLDHAAGHG